MNTAMDWVGCPVALIARAFLIRNYGTTWYFGRWFVPQAILAPDGMHYIGGAPLGPIALAFVQAGREPRPDAAIAASLVAAFLMIVYPWRLLAKSRRVRALLRSLWKGGWP
jgi:hypothetical protein